MVAFGIKIYISIYIHTHNVDSIPPLWRVHIGIYGGVKSKHYLYLNKLLQIILTCGM